ncbi:hypothetical protein DCC81_15915 [Chitinophaga parva]|uniref:N-acetyltransferase domain-containing protein n=1 Tax=Chitinophaga parva TaxID=2169414 RepID=A0A2T7BHJ8_9BACT|nr:GNAT family N-acetyltransferase [Chitinophaga parva]PUZ25750.1 hypothetical protein DCC81_15915 [Chitinophaga parva]
MIFTERLILKPYEVSDAAGFYRHLQHNRDYLVDYFASLVQHLHSEEDVAAYFKKKAEQWQARKGFACGVFLKGTGIIGHVSVRDIDWRVPKGELAYFIFKEFTGYQYGAEALAGFRDWCFHEQAFHRLYMKIGVDNLASVKTAERCGFQFEGLLKSDYRKRNVELVDLQIYGCVKV